MPHEKIGTFSIPCEWIRKKPSVMYAIMAKMIIVRCELVYQSNSLEYIAISELFEENEPHCTPPRYIIDVTEPEDDVFIIRAKKIA